MLHRLDGLTMELDALTAELCNNRGYELVQTIRTLDSHSDLERSEVSRLRYAAYSSHLLC